LAEGTSGNFAVVNPVAVLHGFQQEGCDVEGDGHFGPYKNSLGLESVQNYRDIGIGWNTDPVTGYTLSVVMYGAPTGPPGDVPEMSDFSSLP